MKAFCVVAFLTLVLGAACSEADEKLEQVKQSATTAEIIALVEDLPPWTRVAYGSTEIARLNLIVDKLRDYSLSELEAAIVFLYEDPSVTKGILEQDSKTFLILRVLFDVPSSTSLADAKSFGGWIRPELGQDPPPSTINMLWPVAISGDHAVSVSNFMGYLGDSYDAVGEFMYFKDKYGLR